MSSWNSFGHQDQRTGFQAADGESAGSKTGFRATASESSSTKNWNSIGHQDQRTGFQVPPGESAGSKNSPVHRRRHEAGAEAALAAQGSGASTSSSNKELLDSTQKNFSSFPFDSSVSFLSEYASAEQFRAEFGRGDQGQGR